MATTASPESTGPPSQLSNSRVAIAHDYLTQRGGAERVVLSLARAFPDAPIYTSLYEPPATFSEFERHDVRPLWTNRVKRLRDDHRVGLPLYPLAFTGTQIDADLVICSSSGFAHGIRTTGRKLVYCHTPARWLYAQADTYMKAWPHGVRSLMAAVRPLLRGWDKHAMRSASHIIANSSEVGRRVQQHYSPPPTGGPEIVFPPAGLSQHGATEPVPGITQPFLLSVGRLLGYKNVGPVVEAMNHVKGSQLVVVGDGPERDALHAIAGPSVRFLGEVSDSQLRWLYSRTAGLVTAAYEDFGLTPLEAASYGKPTAALRYGGFLDTIVEDSTGVLFDEPAAESIAPQLNRLLRHPWSASRLREHAHHFAESRFHRQIWNAALVVLEQRAF